MKFQKGHIPWHKGKINVYSDETLNKMSKSHQNMSNETREKMRKSAKGNTSRKGSKLSDETKEKLRQINLGKKHTEETKEKMANTHKKLYKNNNNHFFRKDKSGKNNPFFGKTHTKKVKDNISNAVKNRSSENHYLYGKHQSEETKNKISQKLKGNKLSDETKMKMRLKFLERLTNIKGQLFPFYNYDACVFFKKLNIVNNLNGFHAENGGEFYIKELGYWVDYYEPDFNIVIEWDEDNHFDFKGHLKEKDKLRQNEIEKYLDCKFIRIKQNENLNNQLNTIINYTKNLNKKNIVTL